MDKVSAVYMYIGDYIQLTIEDNDGNTSRRKVEYKDKDSTLDEIASIDSLKKLHISTIADLTNKLHTEEISIDRFNHIQTLECLSYYGIILKCSKKKCVELPPNLKRICVRHCVLDSMSEVDIINSIPQATIEEITLGYNISDSPSSLLKIGPLSNLTSITIEESTVPCKYVEHLIECAGRLSILYVIKLNGSSSTLLDTILKHTSLKELCLYTVDLARCCIPDTIQKSLPNIERIELMDCNLTGNLPILSSITVLKSLVIVNNMNMSGDVPYLALEHCTDINTLHIWKTGLCGKIKIHKNCPLGIDRDYIIPQADDL